ncbi:MAG: PA0069 family radical SAM protein [Rhodobacteraceae bacterium]|nr:PA0069 family radical SAM protein [Paracoccaceae bacterium]
MSQPPDAPSDAPPDAPSDAPDGDDAIDESTPLPIAPARRRARGVISNRSGRFDLTREETHDGWDIEEERPAFQTQVILQPARRIITRNASPDLSFDRSINPYRGCEHGCIYCYARPSHAYLGFSPGLDFETRLIARPNAAHLLESELRARHYRVAPIAIGTNTDPYQPIERDLGIMRGCLEVLERCNHPVTIITKGTLIERDRDILARMARRGLVQVGVSVTTLDARVSRVMEPRVPLPARRLQSIQRLAEAGVPVRVMVSPVVPALTDHEPEAILRAAARAGAGAASWIMLRLPLEIADLYAEWARAHFPDRANRMLARMRDMHGGKLYDTRWHVRWRGRGPYAALVGQRIKVAMRRNGLDGKMPALRRDLFAPPLGDAAQPSLF